LSKSLTEEQIREMARLTLLTNRLNPIQEKNLKMYPLVFFNGVKEAKIDFDLSNDQMVETIETVDKLDPKIEYKFNQADTSHLRVSYHLEIEEGADNHTIDARYSAITQAVQNLLFKETKVQVFINKKLAYESKNERRKA
jgi:hypothetical protein